MDNYHRSIISPTKFAIHFDLVVPHPFNRDSRYTPENFILFMRDNFGISIKLQNENTCSIYHRESTWFLSKDWPNSESSDVISVVPGYFRLASPYFDICSGNESVLKEIQLMIRRIDEASSMNVHKCSSYSVIWKSGDLTFIDLKKISQFYLKYEEVLEYFMPVEMNKYTMNRFPSISLIGPTIRSLHGLGIVPEPFRITPRNLNRRLLQLVNGCLSREELIEMMSPAPTTRTYKLNLRHSILIEGEGEREREGGKEGDEESRRRKLSQKELLLSEKKGERIEKGKDRREEGNGGRIGGGVVEMKQFRVPTEGEVHMWVKLSIKFLLQSLSSPSPSLTRAFLPSRHLDEKLEVYLRWGVNDPDCERELREMLERRRRNIQEQEENQENMMRMMKWREGIPEIEREEGFIGNEILERNEDGLFPERGEKIERGGERPEEPSLSTPFQPSSLETATTSTIPITIIAIPSSLPTSTFNPNPTPSLPTPSPPSPRTRSHSIGSMLMQRRLKKLQTYHIKEKI